MATEHKTYTNGQRTPYSLRHAGTFGRRSFSRRLRGLMMSLRGRVKKADRSRRHRLLPTDTTHYMKTSKCSEP